jgi:CheY-like chemotaxis protein
MGKKECLLIDDDLDDQEIFKLCVQKIRANVNCTAVNDGSEALTLLTGTDYTPDFIFLDVNMPKMNGIDCLRMLKRIDRLKNTLIFMYSTTSEKKTVEEAKKLGADDFVIKPSKTTELKDKLAQIFKIVSGMN